MAEQRPALILVADNPASQHATARVLRQAGFEVEETSLGADALERAGRREFDLVVLDADLPDLDGYDLCRRLRADPVTAQIPIVLLPPGFVRDADRERAQASGADVLLTHPVDPLELATSANALVRARRVQEELRRSEGRFRAVFDEAPSGIALVDEKLHFVSVNPAMCTLLGRHCDELHGLAAMSFASRRAEHDLHAIVEALRESGRWTGIVAVVRKDGSEVELEWHISRHERSELRVAVVSDITGRRRAEQERERLLASERAARADAERANRLKDDFLATLSHELRNPLSSILGWLHVLRQKPDGSRLKEGLDAIERGTKQQTQLISDLLDVSSIVSGKLHLEFEAVDLRVVVDNALDVINAQATAKQLTVERDFPEGDAEVLGDPTRLYQVIWNLLTNAVKFTPARGRIHVGIKRIDDALELSVTDTGQGIDPAFLPFAFDRFRQADASTTRRAGGLGLGLAIVRHLSELHGGSVEAFSEGEGRGSRFTVRLPLRHARGDEPAAAPPPSPDVAAPPPARASRRGLAGPGVDLKGWRVLAVEDDDDIRSWLRRVIAEAGADVAEARNVETALALVESFRPHILVSDIGMAPRDGYSLMREIRSRGITPESLPGVALTAFARPEDRREILAAGYQIHLPKPVSPLRLLQVLTTLVRR
ncbi:MAG TPA: response regulator [Solimonas sp.]|nr:response regulator [Solimonas sp.]